MKKKRLIDGKKRQQLKRLQKGDEQKKKKAKSCEKNFARECMKGEIINKEEILFEYYCGVIGIY